MESEAYSACAVDLYERWPILEYKCSRIAQMTAIQNDPKRWLFSWKVYFSAYTKFVRIDEEAQSSQSLPGSTVVLSTVKGQLHK